MYVCVCMYVCMYVVWIDGWMYTSVDLKKIEIEIVPKVVKSIKIAVYVMVHVYF